MGWLYSNRTLDHLLNDLLEQYDRPDASREVLEHALCDDDGYRHILWSVIRLVPKQDGLISGVAAGQSYTFIGCDLIDSYQGQWGYKSLSEQVHPYFYNCPLHFLDLAPDGINEEWRRYVRLHHQEQARLQRSA
ncbi:hypothetical protein BZL41_22825 [Pseudomonas sp. PIC25]|uniref:hypothetical protein n=1 Tax=Pseudomonas sp. PIC25 TaxID=1958773 RepID=UPI000BABD4AB|nr:hypothetical protein [Pseudomonas sp. PIC25]PAU54105.1 hypothetical protein BZL41_22825 [Pseudomonas sp. PIC25]